MFAALLKSQPLLDEDSIHWLFDTFAWSVSSDAGLAPPAQPVLVLPTNAFFPGRADSVHAMAEMIFRRVVDYAGMGDWPLRAAAADTCAIPATVHDTLPQVALEITGSETRVVPVMNDTPRERVIGYDPALVGNPEALIASFAHSLATLRAAGAATAPPGGAGNLAYATEVLAVAMGFGVMLANSAKTVQVRSCGSCGSGQANRQSALSQYDITYALALFCQFRDIAAREVVPHLNKPLRPFFKKAARDVAARKDDCALFRQPG